MTKQGNRTKVSVRMVAKSSLRYTSQLERHTQRRGTSVLGGATLEGSNRPSGPRGYECAGSVCLNTDNTGNGAEANTAFRNS